MPELLDLPNELLHQISLEVHRGDIEKFALTCKTVFALSTDALLLHRERKQCYSKVRLDLYSTYRAFIDRSYTPTCIRNLPSQLLYDILCDRKIATYVSTMELSFQSDITELNDLKELPLRDLKPFADSITKSLLESNCSKDIAEAEKFCEENLAGHPDATVGLIVTLVHDIHTLEIIGRRPVGITHEMFRNLLTQENYRKAATPALSHLRNLTISPYHPWEHGLFVELLINLPSLRRFNGTSLNHLTGRWKIRDGYRYEELALWNGHFDKYLILGWIPSLAGCGGLRSR